MADSIWTQAGDGTYLAYLVGAPPFVNQAFISRYPGDLPPQTPLMVVCRADAPAPPLPITVVGRRVTVTPQSIVTYCVRYSVAGWTDETCQMAATPASVADDSTRDNFYKVLACYAAALVARPLPDCWPR